MEPREKDLGRHETKLRLSLAVSRTSSRLSPFRISAISSTTISSARTIERADAQRPGEDAQLADGEALVATVFDLFVANYGVDRGFGGDNVATNYDDNEPYRPAWAEAITGVPRDQIITVAREFALNAEKTNGRSMIIIGAAMNHWYHMDMNYRGHQHAGHVRLRRSVRRRLVALCRPGEASSADRAGRRSPSASTGAARRASRTRPRSSTRTPTSGATRRWTSPKSSRRRRPRAWDGALIDYNVRAERMGWLRPRRSFRPTHSKFPTSRRRRGAGGEGLCRPSR